MRNKMINRRFFYVLIFVLVLCLGIAAYAIVSSFLHKEAKNDFIPADVTISVEENDELTKTPSPKPDKKKELKWDENHQTAKKVAIYNSKSIANPADVFIRVSLVPKWFKEETIDGTKQKIEMSMIDGIKAFGDMKNIQIKTDTNAYYEMGDVRFNLAGEWTLKDGIYQSNDWYLKDGMFYCKKAVKPGNYTPVLLESVKLSDGAYAILYPEGMVARADLEVDVMADSIQTEGGAAESRWDVNVVKTNGELTIEAK